MIKDSQQLLGDYAAHGSEAAFRELVARYINLVYSTALRLVEGNAPLAEDVSQAVFLGLAKKGRALSSKVMLGGWLHQHTYHVATRAMRGERRRQSREREAVEMNILADDSGAHWRQLAPILDEAITQLGREDRTAIVLRYFEQRDFRSVGEALGSTQDAARVRVNRALEKLHVLLKQRGVALSVGTLGTLLTAGAVTAAPAGLAIAISSAALAGTATGTTLTLLKLMATAKLKLGLTALVVAGAATTVVIQHQSQVGENQLLRQQIAQLQTSNEDLSNRVNRARANGAPRLPTPPMPFIASVDTAPLEPIQNRNLYSLLTNRISQVKLTATQAEAYVKENRRSAASLLSAFRASDDPALLQEAMEQYPNDPLVGFEAALRQNASPAERRQWLDTLKQSAPENAFADYLSAADHFKAGQADQAVQDLAAAAAKPRFHDYSADRIQANEEAYRAAGYPVADAKILATSQLALPQLVQMRELGGSLVDLAKSYQQAGDEASRQAALQMAVNLGQRCNDDSLGEMYIGQLVGIRVERAALEAMDPHSPYGADGLTVQDRLNQLTQQRADMKALSTQADALLQTLSDQDWISYENRCVTFGEGAAMRWLVGKYGPQ